MPASIAGERYHIGRRPLAQLRDERGRTRKVERDLEARVGFLNGGRDFDKHISEG
jgi:hypothetical protein